MGKNEKKKQEYDTEGQRGYSQSMDNAELQRLLVDHGPQIADFLAEDLLSGAVSDMVQRPKAELLKRIERGLQVIANMIEEGDDEGFENLVEEISSSRIEAGLSRAMVRGFSGRLLQSFYRAIDHLSEGNDALRASRQVASLFISASRAVDDALVKHREAVISQQSQVIIELSSSVIPLWDGILLLPIVGEIDSDRAIALTDRLLNTVADTGSQVVIIDITGVPVVDANTAKSLIETMLAIQMVGACVVVTGISIATALSLGKLDIDLGGLKTYASLRNGVAEAFRIIKKEQGS